VHEVSPDFHPRYDAVYRSYEYRLFADPVRDPRRGDLRRPWDINLERMRTAPPASPARDFRSFGKALHSGGSTIAGHLQADWYLDRDDLVFEIRGNAFLYRMVRKLVGFLVEIGQEKVEPEVMKILLQERSPEAIKSIAPAHGLTLVAVEYESRAQE
jgi:tRNA pseudouridine38-40 synthase